jgi:hypothetical protein
MLQDPTKYTERAVPSKRARHLCRFRGRRHRKPRPNAGFKTKNSLGAKSFGAKSFGAKSFGAKSLGVGSEPPCA